VRLQGNITQKKIPKIIILIDFVEKNQYLSVFELIFLTKKCTILYPKLLGEMHFVTMHSYDSMKNISPWREKILSQKLIILSECYLI
jgi:hypothetical protein